MEALALAPSGRLFSAGWSGIVYSWQLPDELVPVADDSGDGIPTPTPAPLVALAEYIESLQRTPS